MMQNYHKKCTKSVYMFHPIKYTLNFFFTFESKKASTLHFALMLNFYTQSDSFSILCTQNYTYKQYNIFDNIRVLFIYYIYQHFYMKRLSMVKNAYQQTDRNILSYPKRNSIKENFWFVKYCREISNELWYPAIGLMSCKRCTPYRIHICKAEKYSIFCLLTKQLP